MIGSSLPVLPNGLRQAPDGGPPLREDEAVPMPVAISFGDVLANLNPLHHIPVVGWVYRQVTGESVNPAFRALGGFLLGGPVGAIVAAVGAIAESLFGAARDGGAGGAVALAPAPSATPGQIATARLAHAAPSGPDPGPADGRTLAARPTDASDFAERMLRGLDAYERTLRLRPTQG
jgi:hypothetical protein